MVTSQTVAMPRPGIERLAAGSLSAVVIARLLTPTDAAPTGETLWIAQASLLAFLMWTLAAYWSKQVVLKFNWSDATVGLLCLGHVISALVVVSTSGDKRAAMTMLWEWVGIAVTWFLMRQFNSPAERQGLLLVVAAAAVSLAGLGIWQHHFGYAESRKEYEKLKAKNAALASAGLPLDPEFVRLNIPVEEGARMLWEQRLYSAEPIGMFALANTLAGVLVTAGILWLGMLACARSQVPAWLLALGGLLTLLILYGQLLTKSRTAFVGLGCEGLAAWALRPWVSQGSYAASGHFGGRGGGHQSCSLSSPRRPAGLHQLVISGIGQANSAAGSSLASWQLPADALGIAAKLATGGRARQFPAELPALQAAAIERRDRRPAQPDA